VASNNAAVRSIVGFVESPAYWLRVLASDSAARWALLLNVVSLLWFLAKARPTANDE
jgi:hypothetical protein